MTTTLQSGKITATLSTGTARMLLPAPDVYLDVETDWSRRLTIVGIWSPGSGLVQLVAPNITPERVSSALPATGTLFTFNGHSFDLPLLGRQLGLALRQRFCSVDLRYLCQRQGLRGGQKAIEMRIGVQRALPGLNGRAALLLWSRWKRGDAAALATLLAYNAEDLRGLMAIRDHVTLRGPASH